jgi:serine/threonine-protein kinase HSL1, negative regulator of Swe1 kinase
VKAYRPPSPPRHNVYDTSRNSRQLPHLRLQPANPRLAAISKDHGAAANKRDSFMSTASTDSNRGVKKFIGPWKLGRTLGHGATARVRLGKHSVTGQKAAVKIVQKGHIEMSHASSLADLDRAEALRPSSDEGLRRMPIGIEREVAIMKLIQHPHIMKLYDIWENHAEM